MWKYVMARRGNSQLITRRRNMDGPTQNGCCDAAGDGRVGVVLPESASQSRSPL